jgi:hypothetical protein
MNPAHNWKQGIPSLPIIAPTPPTAFGRADSAPKVCVIPLQGLELVGANTAVAVHLVCHLVEVVGRK